MSILVSPNPSDPTGSLTLPFAPFAPLRAIKESLENSTGSLTLPFAPFAPLRARKESLENSTGSLTLPFAPFAPLRAKKESHPNPTGTLSAPLAPLRAVKESPQSPSHTARLLLIVFVIAASSTLHAQRVLGNLGQAVKTVVIYSRPSSHSGIYYRAKAFEYLVVQPSSSKYLRVLMQNGIYGYANKAAVNVLPYEVTAKQRSDRSQMVASRGMGGIIANYGLKFIGTPYKWGGNDVQNGIDCSGFVKQLYRTIAGVSLPRTAAEQALVGTPITRLEDLQPGDRLYFWESKRSKIGHTGIYIGNGYFVHSSHGHNGVATDFLTQNWRNLLVSARR